MILWPKNLFPLSLIGGGLRIGYGAVIIERLFSGRFDPKRIYVELPAEQTLVSDYFSETHTFSDDTDITILTPAVEEYAADTYKEYTFSEHDIDDNTIARVTTEKTAVEIYSEPSMVTLQ